MSLMSKYQVLLAIIFFIFGVSAKFADLYNEHGLEESFRGASLLAGVIWGVCGVIGLVISPIAGLTYIAHVLYWFNRIKLEYYNHALAGVMILLGGYYFQGNFLFVHRNELFIVYLCYLITGYFNSYLKTNYPNLKIFLRLRLRIYLIPICYALYKNNMDPIIATVFGMLATELVTFLYRKYSDDVREMRYVKID